jgi:CheY-like chemotaxis protein
MDTSTEAHTAEERAALQAAGIGAYICPLLTRLLSPECDVVGVIADGREVAEAARRLQPVVIVLDLNLPNASGLDVCRQIAQNHPQVKIIVISAMIDDHIRDEALAARRRRLLRQAGTPAGRCHQTDMDGPYFGWILVTLLP